MTDISISTEHQKQLLRDLSLLVHERAQSERQIQTSYQSRTQAADTQYDADHKRIVEKYETDKRQLISQYESSLEKLHRESDRETHRLAVEQAEVAEEITHQFESQLEEAKEDWARGNWADNPRFELPPGDDQEFIPLPPR